MGNVNVREIVARRVLVSGDRSESLVRPDGIWVGKGKSCIAIIGGDKPYLAAYPAAGQANPAGMPVALSFDGLQVVVNGRVTQLPCELLAKLADVDLDALAEAFPLKG